MCVCNGLVRSSTGNITANETKTYWLKPIRTAMNNHVTVGLGPTNSDTVDQRHACEMKLFFRRLKVLCTLESNFGPSPKNTVDTSLMHLINNEKIKKAEGYSNF